jgi:hypothetical protein
MGLIKNPVLNDPSAIARLAPVPAKLQQMLSQLQQIEDECIRIQELLDHFSQATHRPGAADATSLVARASNLHNGRGHRKKIRIVVDWTMFGAPGGIETICEHMASDSLVRFVTRLYQIKGIEVLERLSNLRVNRGFFVSKNPTKDYRYWNGSADAEYQNQPIADSGFVVLTNTDTNQKISDIKKACQFLGVTVGAVKVEEVDKNDWHYA